MTKEKVIKVLENNIKIAQVFIKGARTKESKSMTEGLVNGYRFAIELLKSK